MKILEENSQIVQLNEIFVNVLPSLPQDIESSIYYAKLKNLLHPEIINFCKEQLELKSDLQFLRMNVGEALSETEIREYLDTLKQKYNSIEHNVGLDYHIEATRVDYGVAVFCVIKRDEIYMKKFVFRFRKKNQDGFLGGLSTSQIPDTKKKSIYSSLLRGGEDK